jgi:hypothetical protein
MGRTPYLAYLWPGLPTILTNGSWLGLAWASGFAVLINLLILSSVWWPELFVSHVRNGLWLATAVFWGGATITSLRALRDSVPEEDVAATYGDATRLYLQADWFGAEQILIDLIGRNSRDVDAGLMLASLWRHTGRIGEASQQLDRLELLDGARKWMLEIHQERKLLDKATEANESVLDLNRAA